MNILLDLNSLQVWVHNSPPPEAKIDNPNGRISTFKKICKNCNLEPKEFSWTSEKLKGFLHPEKPILAILTKIPKKHQFFKDKVEVAEFKEEEIKEIVDFVKGGGRLLLMSNHPPFRPGGG